MDRGKSKEKAAPEFVTRVHDEPAGARTVAGGPVANHQSPAGVIAANRGEEEGRRRRRRDGG